MFASFQQTSNRIVQGLDPMLFTHYADYLLGEFVLGLVSRGPDGVAVAGPSWPLVLSYEYEIRAHACRLICEEGLTLEAALRKSWADTTLRDLYFLTPLKVSPLKAKTPPADTPSTAPPRKKARSGNSNINKGKGGGMGQG